jgi:hypothetical protein
MPRFITLTKTIIALLVVLGLGFYFGAMYFRLQEYARSGSIALQGNELLSEIENYKANHADFPSQEWFQELGDKRITSERRLWIYHTPPLISSLGDTIIISVPVDRDNSYLYGNAKGHVTGGSYERLQSGQDAAL